MSVKRLTARERFVEAMQTITDGIPLQAFGKMMAAVRQAVEAFGSSGGSDGRLGIRLAWPLPFSHSVGTFRPAGSGLRDKRV